MNWNTLVWLTIAALFASMIGAGSYPLLGPDEARHAGIVHDMWAAQQHLLPRVDGFPALDAAPLYYWLSMGFLFLFGVEEWAVRLPSALSAALALGVMAKVLSPWRLRRALVTLVILFLAQPGLVMAGRFASPDMLNILLLTVAVGSFLQAANRLEAGQSPAPWIMGAWVGTALLGLGAGALAVGVPLIIVCSWLALRRRFDIMRALCWWRGLSLAAALILPWLWMAARQYPGIVASMLEKQALAVFGHARYGWVEPCREPCGLLLLGGILPILICLYRFRDPVRRQAIRTPTAGLMAVWLAVLVPLHPLVVMTVVGPAAILAVPLLYFGVLALVPGGRGRSWEDACAWLLHVVLIVGVGMVGLRFFGQRASTMPAVVQVVSELYRPTTDKVILLDRYDYEFSFYMRSPKLVYVVSDWVAGGDGAPMASWQRELLGSARFAPDTAQRLLLTHQAFLEKLCEPRVVNLWVIGSERAVERHPILSGLTQVVDTGTVRAWYLDAGDEPMSTSEGDRLASKTCAGVR